jgi:hypothetical protein
MPLQNRVTPFGEIVAIRQRGLFTGNRGIIHDPATKTLLNRRWTSKAWIICSCEYKGRRRVPMGSRSWTELFFLDEAVALAAGHRPCFACRREAAEHFRDCWRRITRDAHASVETIDRVLHEERQYHGKKRIQPLPASLDSLPDGVMVTAQGSAFTRLAGRAYRWTSEGYASAERLPRIEGVLTPPSTVAVLALGYRPVLHPSISQPQ